MWHKHIKCSWAISSCHSCARVDWHIRVTARLATKASFHGRLTKFSAFLFFPCFSLWAKRGPNCPAVASLIWHSGFHQRTFSNCRDSLDAMSSATILLVFAMLQGVANVFGNPLLSSGINTALEGLRRTRCEVTDHFVSHCFKATRGLYSRGGGLNNKYKQYT